MLSFRVALVGPEFEENLGLRYLHAALTRAGHEVRILDFRGSAQAPEVVEQALSFRADVVGLSMTFARRGREFADLAADLRKAGFGGHLTCGGHFATVHAEDLLRDVPALDTVVLGEGEEPLVELLANLDRPGEVAGLCYRLADGAVAHSAPRPVPDSLDARAWPVREKRFDEILGLGLVDMVSGRGCWAACRFCSIEAWHRRVGGKRFRQRSVADVAEEMAGLYAKGARIFNFTDDNFFLPEREASLARIQALRAELNRRGIEGVALQVKARPESISPAILDALRELGVFRIFLGVESDSARSLQALGRRSTPEEGRRALELSVAAGFHVSYNLLLFEPETTLAEVRSHLGFVQEHGEVPVGICRVEVYGGTALEAQLKEQGRLQGDYFGYDYALADPAAEAVCRAWYQVLGKRFFDLAEGMGPRSMALDYQLHLLDHVWPGRATSSLRDRVHAFVRELNEHSCRVLGEMCDAAQRSPAEMEQHVARWQAECEAFEKAMDSRSKRLFVELAALARLPRGAFLGPLKATGVVCFAIFLVAFAVVTFFGQNLRALFAASTELGGEEVAPPRPPGPRKPIKDFSKPSE